MERKRLNEAPIEKVVRNQKDMKKAKEKRIKETPDESFVRKEKDLIQKKQKISN